MAGEPTPEGKVRRWVQGVLSQARDELATTTRAVLWNAGAVSEVIGSTPPIASGRLAQLLPGPLAELGSADPEFDASLVAYATFGKLGDYVWGGGEPTDHDVRRITAFCLRTVTPADADADVDADARTSGDGGQRSRAGGAGGTP